MRCARLYEALLALSTGNDHGAGVREDLVGLGLAAPAASPGAPGELERLKSELLGVRQELDAFVAMRDGTMEADRTDEELDSAIAQARKRESGLRMAIIQKVCSGGAPAGAGQSLSLTYNGREALQTIGARLPSAAELNWSELARRLELLRSRLASEAAEAAVIFKEISKELPPAEHHLLRSAAVGLASVPGEPVGKSELFSDLIRTLRGALLDNQHSAVGAEIAILQAAEKKSDPRAYASELAGLVDKLSRDQRFDTRECQSLSLLLLALPAGEKEPALEAARMGRDGIGSALGPALLRLGSPGLVESAERARYFQYWVDILRKGQTPPPPDAVVAAALLATARGNREAVEGRFREAAAFLGSLFEESLYTPSAVIALWPGGVEESLDNIRMAASEILQRRLSLGGMENFSLGMKLLSNNSQFAALGATGGTPEWMRAPDPGGHPPPSTTAVAAATAAAAATAGALLLATPILARAPFTIFHSLTVQQAAFRQVSFHPVHSHYLYG